jgi:2-polyprenyl-3-methyl-5-hydroxy-6-metoxy-1,4-benzoquinol methylase
MPSIKAIKQSDIMRDATSRTKTLWRENLIINSSLALSENLCRELAEYENIAISEANRRLSICKQELNYEWQKIGRNNPLAFYQNTRWYLYDLTLYHSNFGPHEEVFAVLSFCLSLGLTKILDFGAGIGSNSIIFAKAGLRVTLADVSPILLDYARWRFKKRGLEADFITLGQTALASESFDAVIATDVFEHLTDPKKEIRQIASCLSDGGWLFFNITETQGGTHPMHICKAFNILRHLRCSGFVKAKEVAIDMHRYRKVKRSPLKNYFLWLYDSAYYSLYYPAVFILKKMGLLVYLKKYLGKYNNY